MSSNFQGGKCRTARGDAPLRYEDAAEVATVTGWRCVACGMFWHGNNAEHQARYCCHTDAPCDCGARKDRHDIHCKACWERISAERYAKLEQVDVAAVSNDCPLVSGDKYFYDDDSLIEHCIEFDVSPSSLQLLLCEAHNPSPISIADLFCDYTGEDGDLPGDGAEVIALETALEAYIEKNKPWCWIPDHKRRPTDANLAALDAEFERCKAEPDPLGS